MAEPEAYTPIHFFDQPIQPVFHTPPTREKTPGCPDGFIWNERTFRVTEMLSSWSDFGRRGKMARNMRPAHASVAAGRGSLNVGRFYFRVLVDTGQVFDFYYDRAMKSVDDARDSGFFTWNWKRSNEFGDSAVHSGPAARAGPLCGALEIHR